MEVRTRKMMLARLDSHRVEIICQTIVEGLGKGSVICRQGGLRFEIGGVDNLVLALGYKANSLNPQGPSKKIHQIGDCVQPRRAIEAVHEGFLLGVELWFLRAAVRLSAPAIQDAWRKKERGFPPQRKMQGHPSALLFSLPIEPYH
jgi:hypothetical protein